MSNLFSSKLFGGFSNTNNYQINPQIKNENISNSLIIEKPVNNITPEKQLNKVTYHSFHFILDDNIPYRNSMEDFIKINENLTINDSLFTLYDGHGGSEVADYSSNRLPEILKLKLSEKYDKIESLVETFKALNNELKYAASDTCGSTAAIVLISDNKIFSANVGDSNIYLLDINNRVVKQLSEEHNLSNIKEKERIESEGGKIINNRVGGSIIVSRSIGDHFFNKYGLSNIPFTHMEIVTQKEGKLIILASDGIWDVLKIESIFDIFNLTLSCKELAIEIVNYAKNKGSRDNISCIVIKL